MHSMQHIPDAETAMFRHLHGVTLVAACALLHSQQRTTKTRRYEVVPELGSEVSRSVQ